MTDPEDVAKYKTFGGQLLRHPDNADFLVMHFAHLFNTADRTKVHEQFPLAQRAWRIEPGKYTVAFNYATALSATGKWLEAIALFKQCVERAPDKEWLGRAHHHLGIAYRSNGDDAEAIEQYDKAIELTGKPEIQKDRALTLMATGKLRDGLQAFECRRQCCEADIAEHGLKGQGMLPPNMQQKHWQGEDLTGKTVVVYDEEGVGDFFMMCRFIPRLYEYGAAKVLLTGKVANMVDLVADNIRCDGTVPLEEFEADYVVGSMTVPWRTGADLEDVNGKPYFEAEPATFPRRSLLNVGLVWRGNPAFGRNSHRSMTFTSFCPLFDIPGVAFYSLQVGDGQSEITAAGYDGFVADLAPFAKSWRMTARLIQRLDCIVSVDTACAHLAGALGVPVFTMITKFCDWRWDRKSNRTVWYDSMRTVRQTTQDDWRDVVTSVKHKLEDMVDERRQDAGRDQQGLCGEDAGRARAVGS
jgi:hypothetical protein